MGKDLDDRNFTRSKSGVYGTSGWMTRKEMKSVLEVSSPANARGIILGHKNGSLICLPENETQKKIAEDNMGLVGTVIKENVRNVNNLGIFTYQDIFQIGCVGLTKAAMNYQPGKEKFCTCAYIYIRNEIFNALDYATVRRRRESTADTETLLSSVPACDDFEDNLSELDAILDAAKSQANGVTAKGIDALKLMAEGYSCREIGELMGGVSANNITAWISKARAFLKNDRDISMLRDSI